MHHHFSANALTTAQLAAWQATSARPNAETLFDADAGTVAIGRHPDGGDAVLELYSPDGATPATITGRAGSEIGTLLNTLWDAEHAATLVEPWTVDLHSAHTAHRPPKRHADTMERAVELLNEARELVLARVHDDVLQPTFEGYRPTADQPLVTLTLVGLTDLIKQDKRIRRELEAIARWARRGGLSLRSVDRPDTSVPGPLGRTLANGSRIELLAGAGSSGQDQDLPGTGLLTLPFGEPVLFRTWPPMPGA
ncbi:hypothetical protein [Kitasatospora sp. NBC_01300]|uniref:hypothetical protein n=1 Tax=Kitasatospora sp. NBC_01300 TaxID=2903574 RepID=UPI002F90ECBC|nr:hypothetical protein OG556_40265 [Kitasatospora sp. NBC_01300]